MSDIFDSLWCEYCAAVTAHHVLADHRFECAPCGALRGPAVELYGLESAS